MGFFDKLFGFKKKKSALGEDDGQAQYFKEDFKPVKKVEAKAEKTAEVKTEKKAEPKKASTAKKAEKEITEDSPEVKSAVAVKESKPTKNGKFDIQKAKDGRFFFSLYSSNGAVVAYSQIYSSLSAVNTGIASVI